MLQTISRRQPAYAAADNHHVMPRQRRRAREHLAVTNLVADSVIFAIHVGGVVLLRVARLRGHQRKVDWAPGGHRSCNYELDEVSAIGAHAASPSIACAISVPASAPPSARMRKRYQSTIATSENTKMTVETALISGVMPRRSRPQISSGSVLSRPIKKKLTAISSIDNVKISRAAPIIGSFRFGNVMRQNVCQ